MENNLGDRDNEDIIKNFNKSFRIITSMIVLKLVVDYMDNPSSNDIYISDQGVRSALDYFNSIGDQDSAIKIGIFMNMKGISNSVETEKSEELKVSVDTRPSYKLILFNDDVNSFDHVITSLMTILEIESELAHKYTLLAHDLGKVCVKTGEYLELIPYKEKLTAGNLSVEIT